MSLAATAAVLAALWPGHLAVGASRPPGEVPALDARYQYLAGGVNTGSGWSTWNEDGTFVSRYVEESHARGVMPVLTYYMLLQSRSSFEGGEAEKDLAHLRDPALMRAYWRDFTLALRRAKAKRPAILHVEPDLGARFDYVFNDVADRDAGFRQHVLGDGGRSRWDAADFHRHARFIRGFTRRVRRPVVIWQIPLGHQGLPDTWGCYRDDRVEWWLGTERDAHLREARDAGIVALLFGGGADGTTSPETDGGLFFRLTADYLRNPLKLR